MSEPSRPLRVALVCAALALTCAPSLRAEVVVSLQYESKAELELARRVASELASEGYTVETASVSEPSPCDPSGPKLVTTSRGTKAWVRLATDPADPDRVVAFICYLGAQPLLQQTAPSAPRAESDQLALAAAEALNGLRVRLPPLENEPERAPRAAPRRVEAPPPPPSPRREPAANSLLFGASLVRNFPDFPVTPGVAARAALGVVPALSLAVDVFVPTTGAELSSQAMTADVRTTWLRLGPRLDWPLGDLELSAAVLAGPALTWATAEASPPRTGTTDIAHSAILSLGASAQYPRTGALFGSVALFGSALLPGARVELGDEGTAPQGSWLVDGSVGVGVRWGE